MTKAGALYQTIVGFTNTIRSSTHNDDNTKGSEGYYSLRYIEGHAPQESRTTADDLVLCIPFGTPKAVPLNKPVDLGLPSGRLWSNLNLGAASLEDVGLYYQWGNLDGHTGTDGYDFRADPYSQTPGSQINTNLPLANDAANDMLGGYWRMPTRDDFDELLNNTTKTWTSINGVNGIRFTSTVNGNSIFMPAAGQCLGTAAPTVGTEGRYWSSTNPGYAGQGRFLKILQSAQSASDYTHGLYGYSIRPVLDPPVLVGDDNVGEGTHNYAIENLDNIASISASVSTPTTGSVSVSTSGLTAILNVTGAPTQEESVTLTVVATLTNGSTWTITKSVLLLEGVEYVDLGLPSGLLWCKHNLGATNPEDAGLYFSWGETVGYADAAARNAALGRSDGFSFGAYTATGGAAITDSVLTWAHDAAAQIMGGDWRMPTIVEFQELLNNTNVTYYADYAKFENVTTGKYIILPLCKEYSGNYNKDNYVNYFSSTNDSHDGFAWSLFKSGSSNFITDFIGKSSGSSIRPVRMPTKAVDLGLPSGTLWADRNIGAWSPEDEGLHFAWGETEGYKSGADRNAKLTAETGTTYTGGFDQTSYDRPGGASGITGNLSGSNDAATVNLGGSWRMPTKEEFQELINYTDVTYSYPYVICTSKADNTKSIKIHFSKISGNQKLPYTQTQYWAVPDKGDSVGFIASNTLNDTLDITLGIYVSYSSQNTLQIVLENKCEGFEIRPVQ